MKKVLALALVSTIALFGAQSADAANPKSGAACKKVNQNFVLFRNKVVHQFRKTKFLSDKFDFLRIINIFEIF
jgi:hypothetical protein